MGVGPLHPFARGLGAVFAGLVVAGALPAGAAEPIGAARCGTCHPKIYRSWSETAHARSLAALSETQRDDPTCRACHTLDPGSKDQALAGVQCESCHGAGSDYSPEHVMRDPKLSRLLGLTDVNVSTCRACHEGVGARLEPYDWRTMVKAMAHPDAQEMPAAEPGGLRRRD